MKPHYQFLIRPTTSALCAFLCFAALLLTVGSRALGAPRGAVIQWWLGGSQLYPPESVRNGVVAIAAGAYHYMALKEDGSVVVWGSSYFGLTNVPAAAKAGVKAIAAGYSHALALKTDGTVVGWGFNEWGEASPPAGLSNVIAIAAGFQHSMALKNDGAVVTWGCFRPLDCILPEAVKNDVVAIAAGPGSGHAVALKTDGSFVQWRLGGYTNLADIPEAAQNGVSGIASGGGRTIALKTDGSIAVWGNGRTGPLVTPNVALNGVVAVSAGSEIATMQDYILALKNDGMVIAWGTVTNTPPVWYGNGRYRAIAAGGDSALFLYEPLLPVILPFNYQHWTVPAGHIVSLRASARLDSLAPYATAQWHFNGRPMEGIPTTNLVISDQTATLRIPITNVNQSGIYTIVYRNDSGSVTSAPLAGIDVKIPWITQISLQITQSSNDMMIAWHTNALDFVLQSTTNLTAPPNWTDWAEAPSVFGSQFVVTNHLPGPHQFFRLFRPWD